MSEPIAAGRLHPSSLLFRLVPHARALLLPGLAVLLLSREGRWEMWLMLMFIPSTIYELLQYLTLRYRIGEDELVLRSGLLWRRERRIPVSRVHSVDLTRGPLHRLLRVADVRLETAGGDEPEAVLRVLGLDSAERLRVGLSRARAGTPGAGDAPGRPVAGGPTEGETLVHLRAAELVKLGLVSMRGAAAAAIIVGLAWELDLVERLGVFGQWETLSAGATSLAIAMIVGIGMIGVPLLLIVLSVAWSVVRLHGFRLEERGEQLHLSCGLLTRVHETIPRRRIQLVSVISTPVHRLFGRVSVRIETAGGSIEREGEKVIGQKWFIPLLPAADLDRTLARVTGRLDLAALEWEPISARAFRRRAKVAVLGALILTAIVTLIVRPWGLACPAAFVPLMLWHARAELRRTGYALFDGGVAFRSGVVTRRTSVTFLDRIQLVSLDESPFDRRARMASVDVDTAGGGTAGHRIRIPYLDREAAERVHGVLAVGAGRTAPSL